MKLENHFVPRALVSYSDFSVVLPFDGPFASMRVDGVKAPDGGCFMRIDDDMISLDSVAAFIRACMIVPPEKPLLIVHSSDVVSAPPLREVFLPAGLSLRHGRGSTAIATADSSCAAIAADAVDAIVAGKTLKACFSGWHVGYGKPDIVHECAEAARDRARVGNQGYEDTVAYWMMMQKALERLSCGKIGLPGSGGLDPRAIACMAEAPCTRRISVEMPDGSTMSPADRDEESDVVVSMFRDMETILSSFAADAISSGELASDDHGLIEGFDVDAFMDVLEEMGIARAYDALLRGVPAEDIS